jgi:hyperosmotically inducible protein
MRGGVGRFCCGSPNVEETMTVLTNAGVLVAMLALSAVAVVAGQHVVLTDQQIKLEVEHRLMDERITGVSVDVRDRVVTLGGTVANLWARDEASEEAREVTDVEEVVNLLGVRRAESDRDLAANLAEKVQRHVFLSIFDDIDVEVADGVATLRGFVTMSFKTREIMALTSRVDGVQNIIDKVETLPVSSFDDQIRYALASRIYNDPMFWHYAIHVNPPIHLIVQHGRVTLTGVVASEVERRKAEFLARGVFGVFNVENKLRLES